MGVDGHALTYDGAGNPLTYYNGQSWTFTWKEGRQLATAVSGDTSVSYNYDAEGLRTSKTVGSTTYNYTYLGNKLVRQTWGSNKIDFAYDYQGRPYSLTYNGTTYYYVLNLQGDVVRIADASGAVQASYTYAAWGNVLSAMGTLADVNPLRYRGYVFDAETGLYYLNSRYYDPANRRFANADNITVLAIEQGSVVQFNLFAYCLNNSVIYTDSDGKTVEAALGWATTMWWLPSVDGPLPLGDIIYTGGLIFSCIGILFAKNESNLPSQGLVSEIPDAPDVDAGKQGKHVPGHPNHNPSKSQWNKGETGVRETQEAWQNGTVRKKDGSVRVGTSSDGRKVKVHQDKKGRIHGYPLPMTK